MKSYKASDPDHPVIFRRGDIAEIADLAARLCTCLMPHGDDGDSIDEDAAPSPLHLISL